VVATIICLSASHKHASLPLLESLNFKDKNELMQALCTRDLAKECILIQTCHRVEIYCSLQDKSKDAIINQILKAWSSRAGVSLDIINKAIEIYQGTEAIAHLFYLASGLESMVMGEDQILGQVRTAYVEAKKNGTAKLVLSMVFMKAINIGRKVRTETKINEGSVSISSAAVDLAEKQLGSLASKKALVIGAGEMATLAAETLKRHGASRILIANRTYPKAVDLAKKVSGNAIRFNQILPSLERVDLVIGAVTVPTPIFSEQHIASAMASNVPSKKILMIDISQPRAFDEKVGAIEGVYLRTISDLKEIVDENMQNRLVEAEKVKSIISQELAIFQTQLSELVVKPLISEICCKLEQIRKKELNRAVRKLGESDEKKLIVLERFSRELVERIVQIPIEQLKKAALNGDGDILSVAEELFRIRS
jgi:glutamyl-tRNA reductase